MGVARSWKRGAGGEETASLATSNLRKIVTLFSFCFTSAYMLQQQQQADKHFYCILLVDFHVAKELTKNGEGHVTKMSGIWAKTFQN